MRKQQGFSLIEAMIALLIILFGVLGMMGMQALAVNNTELGRYNARAAIQAQSIAATMKANAAFWTSTPLPTSVTSDGTTLKLNGATVTAPLTGTGGAIAYRDLTTWGTDVATSLPSGNYAISCDVTVTPEVCTITILWFEKTLTLHNVASAASSPLASGTAAQHSFQTLVSIL